MHCIDVFFGPYRLHELALVTAKMDSLVQLMERVSEAHVTVSYTRISCRRVNIKHMLGVGPTERLAWIYFIKFRFQCTLLCSKKLYWIKYLD